MARDGQIPEGYLLKDLNRPTLERYRNLFRSNRPDHPFLTEDEVGFLRQIRAWGVDRESGHEGPTVAGLLAFGTETAIRDRFEHFHLDYRELPPGEETAARWVDRVMPDGTWNANLLEFYLSSIRSAAAVSQAVPGSG